MLYCWCSCCVSVRVQGPTRGESTSAQKPSQDTFWKYCRYMRICVYIRMYVCMYVRMYVSMYVSMYVCMYVSMYVCIQAPKVLTFSPPLPSQGHHLAVYSLKWSPFYPNVFASCGVNWLFKVWDHGLQ